MKKKPPAPARANVAPAPTETLTCATPGCGETWEWTIRGGRKPKLCPTKCRRPANVERSELSYKARARMANEIEAGARATRIASQAVRLAAGLRVTTNVEQAAALSGVQARGAELAQLEAVARKQFPQLIAGDMRDLAGLAEMGIAVFMSEAIERVGSMTPRDVGLVLRNFLEMRGAFVGDGPEENWIGIKIGVEPPRPLTKEERDRVQGRDTSEEARNVKEGADRNG